MGLKSLPVLQHDVEHGNRGGFEENYANDWFSNWPIGSKIRIVMDDLKKGVIKYSGGVLTTVFLYLGLFPICHYFPLFKASKPYICSIIVPMMVFFNFSTLVEGIINYRPRCFFLLYQKASNWNWLSKMFARAGTRGMRKSKFITWKSTWKLALKSLWPPWK